MTVLDASITLDNGKTYFLVGNMCICHNFFTNELEPGYPRPITDVWKGVWGDVDAVIRGQGDRANKLYFFKGNQYLRYDMTAEKIDPGYPASVRVWGNIWSEGVKAAVTLPTNNKIYFFRGKEYIRYNFEQGADAGYPQQISDNWKGVWPDFEAVCMGQGDRAKKVYFFKGDQYIRYDLDKGVDSGYPQPRSVWSGLDKGLKLLSSRRKQRKVRIELLDVHCADTEDVTGKDEFYLVGSVVDTKGSNAVPILIPPVSINDGQTRSLRGRGSVIFEGVVDQETTLSLTMSAFDEDYAKDWSKYDEYVLKMGAALSAGLKVAGAPALVGLGLGIALKAFDAIAKRDKDDKLGTASDEIQVKNLSPGNVVRTRKFKGGSGWWSSWEHTVRYQISYES